MGVDCRLCVRDGKKERKRVSECERVRMRACVCVCVCACAQVSECMSTCVSLFHSYVSSECEYRHKRAALFHTRKKRTNLSINNWVAQCHARSLHVFKQVNLHGIFNLDKNQV